MESTFYSLLILACVTDRVGPHPMCFHLGQLQSHDTPTSDLGMSDYASADICAHTAVLRPAALRPGVPFVADVLPFVPFVNRKTRYS